MKTLIIVLAAVVSLSASGLALAHDRNVTHDGLEHGQACASSVIRIEHTYLRHDGISTYRGWGYSQGTAVAPNIILTHNHFHKADEPLQDETLTFLDPASAALSLPFESLPFVAIDGGTALIYLPNTVSLPVASISDRSTVEQLAAGENLSVCYWDDARERLVQQDFEIIQIKDGVATLADPDRVINPGDSGGGVFFEGRLVGNTWAMHADSHGNPTGAFDVALLPVQVQGLLEMTENETGNGAQ